MKHLSKKVLFFLAVFILAIVAIPTIGIHAEAAHVVVEEGHFLLVSHSASGEPGNGKSTESVISSDGNVVAFNSEATNLVSGDVNDETDIFVVDLSTETIELVSVDSNGIQGNGESFWPQISSTGRWVAFNSYATNFVNNDTNGKFDIFLYDRNTDELVCITMGIDGAVANEFSILYDFSTNDQYVLFASLASNLVAGDTAGSWDLFAYDLTTETVIRMAPYRAGLARISSDGRYIAFKSNDQIDIADTNIHDDIYLYDRNTSETVLVSKSSEGIVGNNDSSLGDISDDGKWILFESYADNLIDGDVNEHCDMFRYEVETGELSMLTSPTTEVDDRGFNDGNALSSDGQQAIYNHGTMGIFWDLQNSGSVWFSFSFETYVGGISGDGQRVTFTDFGSVLNSYGRLGGQIYLLDLNKRELESPYTLSHEDLNNDQSPDAFHWKGVAGADEYTVEIKDNITNAMVTKQTVLVDDVCSDFLCTFSYPTALPIGEYKWHVVARNETGEGEWSSYDVFESTPAAPQLRSPGVDAAVYGGRPTFKWYYDADATSYKIEFYDPSDTLIGEWQKAPECDEVTFCEYRILNTMDLGSTYGDYDWRVRTVSNSIEGPWSETRTFTYTALERTWQISPADGETWPDTTPVFEWGEITGATMYLFQLRLPDDTLMGNYLVSDADFCVDGGSCTWELTEDLPAGEYKWHVRAKNGRNFGRWTAYRTLILEDVLWTEEFETVESWNFNIDQSVGCPTFPISLEDIEYSITQDSGSLGSDTDVLQLKTNPLNKGGLYLNAIASREFPFTDNSSYIASGFFRITEETESEVINAAIEIVHDYTGHYGELFYGLNPFSSEYGWIWTRGPDLTPVKVVFIGINQEWHYFEIHVDVNTEENLFQINSVFFDGTLYVIDIPMTSFSKPWESSTQVYLETHNQYTNCDDSIHTIGLSRWDHIRIVRVD